MVAKTFVRFAVICLVIAFIVDAHALTLVQDGQPVATVVLAEKPTRAAQLAAFELQYHVRLITGATLPLVKGDTKLKTVRILVGESAATRAMGLAGKDFKSQEYLIRVSADTLVLMGRDKDDKAVVKYDIADPFCFNTWPGLFDEQGTCYAVYDFLERFCSVRWFSPTELGTIAPKSKTLTVKGAEVRRSPAFIYRDIGWSMSMCEVYNSCANLWTRSSPVQAGLDKMSYPALHKRFPNRWQYIHAKRGVNRLFFHRRRMGGQPYKANHSFYGYYARFWEKAKSNKKAKPNPADLWVEKRPEYFAKGHKGKPPQMCYASEGLVKQTIQDARDYFDGKGSLPGAVNAGDFFAIVPMDNSAYCKCAKSLALMNASEADSPYFSNGYASDYVFGFANKVAKEIRKSHPDKYIATLAYSKYAYYPERVRLEPNIAVQLCLHVRNVYDLAMQKNDLRFFNSWVTKEKNRPIYLWLYYCFPQEVCARTGWHCFPGWFAHSIDKSFKLYNAHGIRGAFINGAGQDVDMYVTYRLIDDPTLDLEQILDEYFTGYYGAAAAPMKKFYLLVEKIYSNPANYLKPKKGVCVGHQKEEMAWRYLGTPKRMAALEAFVVEARKLAATDLEKQRLALFEKSVWDYMCAGPRRVVTLERKKYPQSPATLEQLLYRKPTMARRDAAQGRPFVLETPGAYFCWKGKTQSGKGKKITSLTDGNLEETTFFFVSKPVEVAAVCELGKVKGKGRQLRSIRVCWSLADSQRSYINLKFAVRDAVTRKWRDITDFIKLDKWAPAKANSFKILTLPFPPNAVTGFDAIRLVDGMPLIKKNTTRFIEIDVVTGPIKPEK